MSQNYRDGNVPTAGDTERILLAKILNAIGAAGNFSGNGAPSFAAQPGSTYVDKNTGAFYVKQTASGSTVWLLKVA